MARLCIRVAANLHPTDSRLNALRTQLGDVVEIMEDGHIWSRVERACGQYRFLDVPGVSAVALSSLVAPKVDAATQTLLARRLNTLDITALRSAVWASRTEATKTQIDAITVART